MSEMYCDSPPPMDTENATFGPPSGGICGVHGTQMNSFVDGVNGVGYCGSPSLESSIDIPTLLSEIVKPPTPPPEPRDQISASSIGPAHTSSGGGRSSELSNLQQSLINEIKNIHQATASDAVTPEAKPELDSLAVRPTVEGVSLNGSALTPLDKDPDEHSRERPTIVHCETKHSSEKTPSADNSSISGRLQQRAIAPQTDEASPPHRLSANPPEQPTELINATPRQQEPLRPAEEIGQSPLNGGERNTTTSGSGSNPIDARNGQESSTAMAVLNETVMTSVTGVGHDNAGAARDVLVPQDGAVTRNGDVGQTMMANGTGGTGSTMEDLEGLNLNLAFIKSQFERKDSKADSEANRQPAIDRNASSRSDILRKRLERYQSVVAGEVKADCSDDEADGEQLDSSKRVEPSREIGELKAQWESGRVNNDANSTTADSESVRDKVSPGLSKTMKVAYEKAIKEALTKESKTSPPEDVSVGHALANTLKKKFESGEVVKEEEAERLEAVRSEKEDDLSVCQDPVIAQQAKLMFQKIDKEITSRPAASPATGLVRTPSDSRWSRSSFGEVPKDIEVVSSNEPSYKEQVEIETAALSERYRFFENYKEEAASVKKKKFQMTPPRELEPRERASSSPPACERDPNVVLGSITTDDIPNVDTATKMRQKFETLCQTGGPSEPPAKTCPAPKPRPLKRTTPSVEPASPPAASTSPHVIEEECMPADNITKNMRAVFERNNGSTANNGLGVLASPAGTERANPPKVNRFVFGTPETEVCAMCQGKVFPMERREASGLVMHTKCFKCTRCNINLRLDGYSQKGGKLYCEAHYQQLFKVKGNYDEGFGCERWSRTPSPSAHDAPATPLNLPPAGPNQTLIA